MHISQITIRDWKAYTTANFDFPVPGKDKNIILIGAPNGYGKTSLFEAIVLGMFGRDGLPLIARSPFSGGDEERLATSYKNFLEKALHRGATAAGRNSCSVKLVFVDDDGEPLEIQRIWHFNDAGVYRPQDEEVHIFRGTTRKAVRPGVLQGNERADWFREYIAENLLPFTLAHFFMFDGEQVAVCWTLSRFDLSFILPSKTGIEINLRPSNLPHENIDLKAIHQIGAGNRSREYRP